MIKGTLMGLPVRRSGVPYFCFLLLHPFSHPFRQSVTLSLVGLVLALGLEFVDVVCGCGGLHFLCVVSTQFLCIQLTHPRFCI